MRIWIPLLLLFVGCSPLKTSLHDEKYQWELTLHEVQTNLDDLRHDTRCFETETQILDARIRSLEHALASFKQQEIDRQQAKIDQLFQQIALLEKKGGGKESLEAYSKETHLSLAQFKSRLEELESEILAQSRKIEALAKLKGNIENLTKVLRPDSGKTYRVRSGDSLEKIAKMHKTDVGTLKQLNQLQQDLIVVDQELKIP